MVLNILFFSYDYDFKNQISILKVINKNNKSKNNDQNKNYTIRGSIFCCPMLPLKKNQSIKNKVFRAIFLIVNS